MTKEEITNILKNYLGQMLKIDTEEIEDDENFFRLGVSSIQALKAVNYMRRELDVDVNPVAMFEFNTISEISEYLEDAVKTS